jgi:hypothetical protein
MLPAKTQQSEFVSQVIPSLFHRTPEQFIQLLSRDGNKFLRFYWDQAGADPAVTEKAAPLGLNYDIREPFPHTQVLLISLPKPAAPPDAYFMALVYRPLRKTPFFGVSDTTKVIVLEMAEAPEGGQQTLLREWTKKMTSDSLGAGPTPRLEAFYETIRTLLAPEVQ